MSDEQRHTKICCIMEINKNVTQAEIETLRQQYDDMVGSDSQASATYIKPSTSLKTIGEEQDKEVQWEKKQQEEEGQQSASRTQTSKALPKQTGPPFCSPAWTRANGPITFALFLRDEEARAWAAENDADDLVQTVNDLINQPDNNGDAIK